MSGSDDVATAPAGMGRAPQEHVPGSDEEDADWDKIAADLQVGHLISNGASSFPTPEDFFGTPLGQEVVKCLTELQDPLVYKLLQIYDKVEGIRTKVAVDEARLEEGKPAQWLPSTLPTAQAPQMGMEDLGQRAADLYTKFNAEGARKYKEFMLDYTQKFIDTRNQLTALYDLQRQQLLRDTKTTASDLISRHTSALTIADQPAPAVLLAAFARQIDTQVRDRLALKASQASAIELRKQREAENAARKKLAAEREADKLLAEARLTDGAPTVTGVANALASTAGATPTPPSTTTPTPSSSPVKRLRASSAHPPSPSKRATPLKSTARYRSSSSTPSSDRDRDRSPPRTSHRDRSPPRTSRRERSPDRDRDRYYSRTSSRR